MLEKIESVWNHGDLSRLGSLTAPGFTCQFGGQPPRDGDQMNEFLLATRLAFPDWHVQSEQVIAEGDLVAVRWSGEVTHKGAFHGIPPTNRRITVSGITIYRIESGKIAAECEQMDSVGMLRQLGVGS